MMFFLGQAQKMKQQRFKNFDKKAFRFGFMLGFNTTDLTVYENTNAYESYGESPEKCGRVGAIVSKSMKCSGYFHVHISL